MSKDSVQTSIWIDDDLYSMYKADHLNLTKFVNDQLRKYFSVTSTKEIDEKIRDLKNQVAVLESKRADLVEQGAVEEREIALEHHDFDELFHGYIYRRNDGIPPEYDKGWITSAKNIAKCKRIGKDPEIILKELKEEYNGLQKDHK